MTFRKAPFSNWLVLSMGGRCLAASLSAAEDRVFETLDYWKVSAIRLAVLAEHGGVMMQSTLGRNNPLRRELAQPFRGAELFVRFQFRYDPPEDECEFFVMWLVRLDGGNRAGHAENIPNIGVHVADARPKKGKMVFIVPIGSAKTTWSAVEMQRCRTYWVVGRLSKSETKELADFDRFELWIDPKADELDKPDATMKHPQSVNFVRWIGFGTGRKIERGDKLYVYDLILSRTWQDVGLLDDTLVVWGGELGRTPTTEGNATGAKRGCDHSPASYTLWMAGGGVIGGQIIGSIDDLGFVLVERPISPADLHATMLHALGLDQHRPIYSHNNRDEIPTVFASEVGRKVFG